GQETVAPTTTPTVGATVPCPSAGGSVARPSNPQWFNKSVRLIVVMESDPSVRRVGRPFARFDPSVFPFRPVCVHLD
ncbi:MAG: hypothetical protein FWG68_02535, partial [Defluviitaleaceae bacterium]|nr:hypothetical protein [Defluviitaleaceae bacterium]